MSKINYCCCDIKKSRIPVGIGISSGYSDKSFITVHDTNNEITIPSRFGGKRTHNISATNSPLRWSVTNNQITIGICKEATNLNIEIMNMAKDLIEKLGVVDEVDVYIHNVNTLHIKIKEFDSKYNNSCPSKFNHDIAVLACRLMNELNDNVSTLIHETSQLETSIRNSNL